LLGLIVEVITPSAQALELHRISSNTTQTSNSPTVVGSFGGYIGPFTIQGTTGFLAEGGGITVLDLQNPDTPHIRRSMPWVSSVTGIATVDNLLYLTDYTNELQILDVTNPEQPLLRGHVALPGYAMLNMIGNNLALVTVGLPTGQFITSWVLQIVDISDTEEPRLRGRILLGEKPLGAVKLIGSMAFVATRSGESSSQPGALQIFDLADPNQPQLRGSYTVPGNFGAVALDVSNGFAYVSDYHAIRVIDVHDPSRPALRGSYSTYEADVSASISSVQVANGFAFVGTDGWVQEIGSSGRRASYLQILDMRNPVLPVLIKRVETPELPNVRITSGRLYAMMPTYGLQIFDIQNPAAPILRGRFRVPGEVHNIRIIGTRAYLNSWDSLVQTNIQVVDVSNSAQPILLGNLKLPETMYAIDVVGSTIVAVGGYKMYIVDAANPYHPVLRSSFDLYGNDAISVQVEGDLAYVGMGGIATAGTDGMRIIDITNPDAPYERGSYSVVSLGHLYVADGLAYLDVRSDGRIETHIIDVGDPTRPKLIGTMAQNGPIRVANNVAYVAGDPFQVIDLNDPSHPVPRGTLTLPRACDLEIVGTFVYVRECDGIFHIVDVSDPDQPVVIGSLVTPSAGTDIEVVGALIYCAEGSAGLRILQADPAQFTPQTMTQLDVSVADESQESTAQIINDVSQSVRSGTILPSALLSVRTKSATGDTVAFEGALSLFVLDRNALVPPRLTFTSSNQGKRTLPINLPMNATVRLIVIDGRSGVGRVVTVTTSSHKAYLPVIRR
jgi:hypothetical protein